MYSPMEVIQAYCNKIGKPVRDMSRIEHCVLNNLVQDVQRGRYSPLLHSQAGQIEAFVMYINGQGKTYENLDDGSRWAYEDVFFGKV